MPLLFDSQQKCEAEILFIKCDIDTGNLFVRDWQSTALTTGLTRKAKEFFFNKLRAVMENYEFTPESICNLDETGITT